MKNKSWKKWAGLVLAVAGAAAVLPAAQAQTAVLVEAGNQRLREDLQWLADRGVIRLSTSSWPLPLSALDEALAARRQDGLSAGDAHALAAVERELGRLRQPLGYGLSLQANTESVPATGFEAPVRAEAQAGAWVQGSSGALAGRLQARRLHQPLTDRQSETSLEGSYLAGQVGGQIIYAGQLAHWWGPGQDGSLIWSNAGTAIPGLGLRRGSERPFETPWLAWLGPWHYELFAGRMQHNVQVPGARAFAMRLRAEPLPGLELGASRMIHWGGPVGDNGPGALWDAFLGRANTDAEGGPVNNEIAGFDARYTWLAGGNPLTAYGQFIGEDETGKLPSKYIGLVGLQYKHVWRNTRLHWHLESADTMTRRLFGAGSKAGEPGVAYTHGHYRDGMYHEGLPIGHFLGGDGRVLALGLSLVPLDSPRQLRYSLRLLKADVNAASQAVNLAFPVADSLSLAELSASWQMRAVASQPLKLRLGLTALHSRRQGNDTGLTLGLELPLD